MIYYIAHSFFIMFVLLVLVFANLVRFLKKKWFSKNKVDLKANRGDAYKKREEENSLDNTAKRFD